MSLFLILVHPLRRNALRMNAVLIGTLLSLSACSSSINSLTVEVKNLYYPDYHERFETKMNTKEHIGDTEYSFKAVAFYPTFSIIDSTKQIVSLSDEPKNPAFKIAVYQDGAVVEEKWAFFNAFAPHFSGKTFLTFRVTSFEYKGVIYVSPDSLEKN